ncbi:cytochrome P450 [Gloeophyllum trabeum ATCC 11539]|uniref:Cytochrome P450 n=1 Tax=Gloeophyllum trabeum (strain ATCC 11539 / FP-39264 / Madison 617) TaxID=670483 RepID=S7Q0S7_GLOTA|nr:cytochrome P450 [Gloeophyllum trabeum ATCC 11539]EPQ53107.1 cytochrome P450 [Gloeophyllum trabeum ATCC 11539]
MAVALVQYAILASFVLTVLYYLPRWRTGRHLKNVPGPPSPSLVTGNLKQLYDANGWDYHHRLLEQYGSAVNVSGYLGQQILYISDPLALYHIIIKEQPIYEEPKFFYPLNYLMWGEGVLSVHGQAHRKQRKMLNPVFSTKHLRNLVPIFHDVTKELCSVIESKVLRGETEIDMLDWMTRTALELIGRAGLGYSFNIMREGTVDEYGSAVKSLFPTLFDFALLLPLLPYLMKIGPPRFRRFLVEKVSNQKVQSLKEKIDIMEKTSKHIYQTKVEVLAKGDEALSKQVGEGRDIMSLLLKENLSASEETRLPLSQVLGQMSTLIFAAMDTTSSALSRIMYLLASNPEVQDRLRQEVRDTLAKEELMFDVLDQLPFLDAICRETLRLHPPVTKLERRTVRDTVLPLSIPITGVDGSTIDQIPLPKGSNLILSLFSLNRNKAIWGEDAYEWKPERWLKPLPPSVTDAKIPGVYSNIMTFSGGPRGCIGFKFSLLEMKVVIASLVESFRFQQPEDKAITWDMSFIAVPRPEGSDSKSPELPLKVSLARLTGEQAPCPVQMD